MTRRDTILLVAIAVVVLGLNFWYYDRRATENWGWDRAVQLHARGGAAFDHEEYEDAANLYRQAVKIWPSYVDAWQDLALTCMSLEQPLEAREAISQLEKLGFDTRQLNEDFQRRFNPAARSPKPSPPPPPEPGR